MEVTRSRVHDLVVAVELEADELGVVLGEPQHIEAVELVAGVGEVDEAVVAVRKRGKSGLEAPDVSMKCARIPMLQCDGEA
jgi:hypothetical protein